MSLNITEHVARAVAAWPTFTVDPMQFARAIARGKRQDVRPRRIDDRAARHDFPASSVCARVSTARAFS